MPITVGDLPTGATPVLVDPADRSVAAGQSLAIQLAASDADGDALVFSSPALPPGASLGSEGLFSWRPTNEDAGVHTIGFVVTDCTGRSASQTLRLEVDAAAPPQLASLSPAAGPAGAQVAIAGSALAGSVVEVFFGTRPTAVYSIENARLVVVAPSQPRRVSAVSVRVVRDGIASEGALAFSYERVNGGSSGGSGGGGAGKRPVR